MPTARTKSAEESPVTVPTAATEAAVAAADPPAAQKAPPQVMVERDERIPDMDRSSLSSEVEAEEDWCLFLYDPLAVGRGRYSEYSITIPVAVQVATQKGALNTYEYRTLAKGLQRIRKKDAELIMKCTSKPFIEMCRRNVLKYWSEEWELSKMNESDAIDAIRRCEQMTLLDLWMEKRNFYTRPIQEDLDKRKEQLSNPPNLQQI